MVTKIALEDSNRSQLVEAFAQLLGLYKMCIILATLSDYISDVKVAEMCAM